MSPNEPVRPSPPAHEALHPGTTPAPAPQLQTPGQITLDFMTNICNRFGNPPDLETLVEQFSAGLPALGQATEKH
jgi:hypothetical protein